MKNWRVKRCARSASLSARCPKDALEADEVDERVEQDLVFAGLIGMIDPPREEAKEAVARAKAAGIRPMMITGDHPITAAVIAAELGIIEDGRAVTGAEIEKMPDDDCSLKRSKRCRSMRASIPNTSCGS